MLRKINLEKYWDREKICRNPHKGWYLHYFDNGLHKYGARLAPEDFLEDFPGLNHIYLRVDWADLEPEEGVFRWEILDEVIEKWLAHGYTVSFRVACKETGKDQVYATPEWVVKAGARGTFTAPPWDASCRTWEPDYGDPVYLEKLENFHRAFAARYDGKPWVEYVDIGSYGDWGEGHTAASSVRDWPLKVIKEHIDIHCRCYKNSILVISDDIVGSREVEDGSKEAILAYLLEKGITLRDDGVSVKWFADRFGFSTLRSPEMFDLFWESKPVNMELEHYDSTVRQGTWNRGLPLIAAVQESHSTFVGFHGYAREWLAENPEVARVLANRAGYWYFLKSVEMPDKAQGGQRITVKLVWENHGVAPAYHCYTPVIRLENLESGFAYKQIVKESDNRKWMPGRIVGETYEITLPETMEPGVYDVSVSLVEQAGDSSRRLEMAFRDEIREKDEFYRIADITIM